MGGSAATTELALDLGPPASRTPVERAVAGLVREAAAVAGEGGAARLEEYTRRLEEERRKIEGFRRELPLCMLIIGGVIDGLKEEMAHCREGKAASGGRPVPEEFMPLKRKHEDEDQERKRGKDFRDMVNWMSSAQLWSDNHSANNTSSTTSNTVVTTNNDASSSNGRENTGEVSVIREKDETKPSLFAIKGCFQNVREVSEIGSVHRQRTESGRRSRSVDEEDPFANCRYRNGGGAFLPFKVLSCSPTGSSREEEEAIAAVVPLPDLSLRSPAAKTARAAPAIGEDQRSGGSSSRCGGRVVGSSVVNVQPDLHSQQQPAPPSQQAAPRKPRRCWSAELHRRFVKALQQLGGSQAATPKQIRELMNVDGLTNDEVKSHLQKYRLHTRRVSTPSSSDQQVVLLGGLWVPPDNFPAPKQSTSQSRSPQGPLHLSGAGRGAPIAAGDSCDEEDGKSESYGWKGHLQRLNGGEQTD